MGLANGKGRNLLRDRPLRRGRAALVFDSTRRSPRPCSCSRSSASTSSATPIAAIPDGPVAVSPADGKVVGIIGDGRGAECTRISIFLNIFDVHVNRAPIAGKIANVEYTKGQFLVASREVASSQNERNTVTIAGTTAGDSTSVRFAQIAGTHRTPHRLL